MRWKLTALLAVPLLTACETTSQMQCPPTEPVTVKEYVTVKPEKVKEAQLQKPIAPELRGKPDANLIASDLADMIAHEGDLSTFTDGLIELIRCRINEECEGE